MAATAALAAITAATSIVGGIAANTTAKAGAKNLKRLGQAEEEDKRRQNRRLIASQTVAFAKAGIALGAGTPLDVLGDSVAEAELQALRVRFARQSEADNLKQSGQQALILGVVQGTSKGLGTVLSGRKT